MEFNTLRKGNELTSLIAEMTTLLNENAITIREASTFLELEIKEISAKNKDLLRPILEKTVVELRQKIKLIKLNAENEFENL